MALTTKRIIALLPQSDPQEGDYLAIDNATSGTHKIPVGRIGVEVDDTLTEEGKAADAKATGDAINAEKTAREQAIEAEQTAREQTDAIVVDLKSEFSEFATILEDGEISVDVNLVDGYVNSATGTVRDNSYGGYYKRTNYMLLPPNCDIIENNFRSPSDSNNGYGFFDENKTAIEYGVNENSLVVPSGAVYVILSDYSTSAVHTGLSITFKSNSNSLDDIRNAISHMATDEDIDTILDFDDSEVTPALVDGFANISTFAVSDNGYDGLYKRTDYIPIPYRTSKITNNFRPNGAAGWVLFDESKQGISSGTSEEITTIPLNAKFIMFSDYASNYSHDGRTYSLKADFSSNSSLQKQIDSIDSEKSCNIENLVTFGDSHVARGGWQNAVLSYFGITSHTNLGIGSSCVAENVGATELPFVDPTRIQAIETADPDTIIIIGGTNDVHLDTPLGTAAQLSTALASKDKTTFYGAYSYLLETLIAWKPSLQIMLCTPPQGYYDATHTVKYSDIAEAVKTIANYYSCPIADIFGKAGINKTNLSTYSEDLIHYSVLGNVRVSKVVVEAISDSYMKLKDSDL